MIFLAATPWYVYLLATAFVLVCLFMMLVILIQKPKGGGLSGAFGGAGSGTQSVMGAKTGEFLTWFTVACFVLFLLLAMGLTWAIHPSPPPAAPTPAQTTGTPGTPGTPGTTGASEPTPMTEIPESSKPESEPAPKAAEPTPPAPETPEAPPAQNP